MISRLKIPFLTGLTFSSIALLSVKILGYGSKSFMVISYLYVILAVIIGLKYEIKMANSSDSLLSVLRNIVVVIEGEEMKLKKLFTGEKYKIKGEVEKLQ